MSNTAVGQLYKRIIDAVVEASRTDFEENGIDNKTLLALQETWQNRLTASQRAQFPWDPQPAPTPAPPPAAPAHQARHAPSPIMPPQNTVQNQNSINGSSVTIKQEPRFDQTLVQTPQVSNYSSGGLNQQYAQQRAAQLLQQQFGHQANDSIAAMQSNGLALPGGQQPRPHGLQLPGQPQQNIQQTQKQQQQTSQLKQEPRDSLGLAQTDGAGEAAEEWDAVLATRKSRGDHEPMGRLHSDRIIRQQVEQIGQRLEAGGLLIPLDERRRARRMKSRSKGSNPKASSSASISAVDGSKVDPSTNPDVPCVARFDGADSDDGLNGTDGEDAINSDLDDSDDGGEDAGIETTMDGNVILCLYDKVQRVKNKWKCVLKDGVVTVNEKDYVFHKAQGEFEW